MIGIGRTPAACSAARIRAAASIPVMPGMCRSMRTRIERRAGRARRRPRGNRIAAGRRHDGTVAELDQQAAGEQRVDVVVFGNQNRKASAVGAGRDGRLRGRLGVGASRRRCREPRGERSRPHRLDQVAGEARSRQGRKIVALRGRDEHELSFDRGARQGADARSSIAAESAI